MEKSSLLYFAAYKDPEILSVLAEKDMCGLHQQLNQWEQLVGVAEQ